ncbi:MAG: hypothetical protein ABSG50_10265 [Opitutaceae bacterium]|jgi:hypothetical protein
MKRLLFLLMIVLGVPPSLPIQTTQICRADMQSYVAGWNDGWAEGWKYVKGKYSYPPYPPYPAYPQAGRDTYQDGYNDGFMAGQREAKKRS